MVSGRTVLLFSVFYYHLTSMVAGAWTRNEIDCYRDDLPKPLAADCLAAIDMIHAGTYILDGSIQKPLKIYLPKSARRLFLMPAIFRSGTCLVHVEAIRTLVQPRVLAGTRKTQTLSPSYAPRSGRK